MDLKSKAREAQLSVLRKYGVLADLSALEDKKLDRAIKGRISASTAQDLTFAAWCDQLLGPNTRVPVACFKKTIVGQTKLSSLAAGQALGHTLKARDKQLQSSLKAAQSEIVRLQSELDALRQHVGLAESFSDEAQRMRSWYSATSRSLHRTLWEIKEIDGTIFDSQGQANRDYRKQLVVIILDALAELRHLGFYSDVELRDASSRQPAAPPIVLYRSSFDEKEQGGEGFEFIIEGVQPVALESARELLWPGCTFEATNAEICFNCHVSIYLDHRLNMDEDEMFHLSCFMHKLFEAMARSGDSRPRAAMREKVILCLLLSSTAPCMVTGLAGRELPRLQNTYYRGYKPVAQEDSEIDLNASAGKIVEHLFRVQQAQR